MLGRRRSSSQKRSIDTTDGRGEYKHLDLDDEIDGDDGDLTPAEVEAPADLAQRVANSKSKLYLESRIELLDESGRVLESHPIDRAAAPRPHYATPRLDLQDALNAGRALGAEGFAAIDFETATGSRASACAVAVAIVERGHVKDVQRWLIQPPGNEYDGFNTSIHGITPEMTKDSPTMAVVWPEVLEVVGDRPLVAHFAAFDMSVLRNALTADGSEWPNLTYFCTCTLAKRGWPGMLSYRLVDLADECGLTFQHHEPGADAATAAELAIACCGLASERQLDAASKALGVRAGQLSSDGWAPSGVAPQRLSDLTPTVDHIPEDSPFGGKTIVFTGTLTSGLTRKHAAQLVVDAGGRPATGVSKKVDYLVLGMQDASRVKDGSHSEKMLKAIGLQRAGAPIELLSEDDFLRMLPE
ncbi:MAG: exonuclease domain-containing protein [Solirubrobacteraceae bacterium]